MASERNRRPANAPTSPETLAEARRLYETDGLTLAGIGERVGLHGVTVCRLAKKHGWRRPAAAEKRRALVSAIRTKVDREIAEVERVLSADGAPGAAVERSARTLASLVKTLRELARIDEDDARKAAGRRGAESGEDEDDAVADLDALRDALARRLDRLREEHEA
ncbi:hypothetical protein [Hansschlegelia zhihuaiae]|uniref:Uncharacterized protein n=1 Tax=Hansschlegelia zhihuaiae TaxID=405005 RepID=A0A4Q0MP05_9HYPH|nr:hypothetical protein [Hansschlegelia zhihuaiae]RXF75464.1 hypothetical protein EK403_00985 [Hansschlegelia zhihuaiae]